MRSTTTSWKLLVFFLLLFGLVWLAIHEDEAAGSAAHIDAAFEDYVETIPGTDVEFRMIAVKGGRFLRGASPDTEGAPPDEIPRHEVEVSSFWMAATEVTWHEYEPFYFGAQGDSIPDEVRARVDAVSRPTPPYIAPDLGWGRGERPAMGMTHFAAVKYCEWLSALTGRRYRLPSEAEWEYAARAGSQEEAPEPINEYAWHRRNSKAQSHEAASLKPNGWGLFDMLGNVAEFCMDFYSEDYYSAYPADGWPADPKGPETGRHRVLRGGSYQDRPELLRFGARAHTTDSDCLVTDPQEPKSRWWYSDCYNFGFRVVRELE